MGEAVAVFETFVGWWRWRVWRLKDPGSHGDAKTIVIQFHCGTPPDACEDAEVGKQGRWDRCNKLEKSGGGPIKSPLCSDIN